MEKTTPTDFRALCAELLNWIERASQAHVYGTQDLITRAHAALAQPEREGEGPSESDVADLFWRHMGEGPQVGFENAIEEVLARWGHSAPEPTR